jgi:hypothetical protein
LHSICPFHCIFLTFLNPSKSQVRPFCSFSARIYTEYASKLWLDPCEYRADHQHSKRLAPNTRRQAGCILVPRSANDGGIDSISCIGVSSLSYTTTS